MKKIVSLFLALTMMVVPLTGCNVKTKDKNQDGKELSENQNQLVDINILAMSSNEKDVNIVRDQLTKNGFNVKLNIQPDYGSFTSQLRSGNFDLAVTGWTTVTGNPDYAVRSLFMTNGDNNNIDLSNSKLDELIEKASTETPDQYVNTYKEFEKVLVEENAYIVPLYSTLKSQAVNTDVLNIDSVRLSKSRSLPWESLDFADTSLRETQPFIFSQTMSDLTSLDPIKGNDGSINIINTNQYVRLVNLTDDDDVTSEGSLSLNHAIADGNTEYYFILRDDINFSKVENKTAIDSGEMVCAEDVVFSLERAKDKDSVPNHRTYTLHSSMDKVEIVTDLAELENIKVSGKDITIKEALENGLKNPIKEIVANKENVKNSDGKYQVVKVSTTTPFPQVLNYLAHQSAGIVSKAQIEKVNTYDINTYDISKDVAYGDQSTITEGATYNNTLMTSGPYVITYKNDYEVVLQKNPGYMKGTEFEPKIKDVIVKFIKDADSTLSAFRSGETHLMYSVPEDKFSLVENDPKFKLQTRQSNGVSYAIFNIGENSKFSDANLRKAVLYSINQDEILAVYNNLKNKTYSTLTTVLDTGNVHESNSDKVKEYLNTYWESQK